MFLNICKNTRKYWQIIKYTFVNYSVGIEMYMYLCYFQTSILLHNYYYNYGLIIT